MTLTCDRARPQQYEDGATGRRYWSVSECLAVLDPQVFDSVPPEVLAAAQARGTQAHALFGLLLLATINLCELPERPDGELAGYYDAMMRFIVDHRPGPVRVEEPSINDSLCYAGTPDCLLRIGKDLVLVDLKTGSARPTHATQLCAYSRLEGYTDAKKFSTLYVRQDGTYTLVPVARAAQGVHLAWFQSGLSVLRGRLMHGISGS